MRLFIFFMVNSKIPEYCLKNRPDKKKYKGIRKESKKIPIL